MDTNTKPQAINLGQRIDDESINRNVIAINALSTKSQDVIGKSSPIVTAAATSKDEMLEITKMLSEQRKRRDDAALRLPPMRCGCRDPLRCRCYSKRGAR
jgi:hypothetical protein